MQFGKRSGALAVLLALVVGGAAAPACSSAEREAATDEGGLERREVLESIANNVVLPDYAELVTATEALESATSAWAQSGSDSDRASARDAWKAAALALQRGELYQFGPAGQMTSVAGGADLRDQLYSWPLVNECRVDQETVEKRYENVDELAKQPVNVRGLDALEYLLFVDTTDNACNVKNLINTDGTWAALGEDGVRAARASYAAAAATLLHRAAQQLHDAWRPDGGNFAGQLATAGDGSSVYSSSRDALNAVSDAMFYLDTDVKDMKLAEPVGLVNCTADVCPEEVELQRSAMSVPSIRANVAAFSRLYYGGEPGGGELGFDDLLRGVGATQVAERMESALTAAKSALDAIEEEDLVVALEQDKQSVVDAHAAVKGVTDVLKTDFVSVLDLDLPNKAEGDND